MDLTEFLTARLDEDEAVARATFGAARGNGTWVAMLGLVDPGIQNIYAADSPDIVVRAAAKPLAHHIARYDPARALREVESGRKLLAWYADSVDAAELFREKVGTGTRMATAAGSYLNAIRAMAAVWSDHPDYDPLWAPPE